MTGQFVGRLGGVESELSVHRCRIDTWAGSMLCDFSDDLRDAVHDALGQMVHAVGTAEPPASGSAVRIVHLDRVTPLPEARPRSLDELAQEHGVQPIRSLHELHGEPIQDFDTFLAAIRSARSNDE